MTPKPAPRATDDAGLTRETHSDLDPLFEEARRHPPAPEQLSIMLRAVPKHPAGARARLWKAAGALVACAAAIGLIVVAIAPPGQSQAFALSRVAEAMRAVPFLKVEGSRATIWESPGRLYVWMPTDRAIVWYHDRRSGKIAMYKSHRNAIVLSTASSVYASGGVPYTLDDLIREAELWGTSLETRWERRDLQLQGRSVVELTRTGDSGLVSIIRIDRSTGRIFECSSGDNVARYTYPQNGPRDIYDLGVPRDASVIDGTASADLLALRDKVAAVRAQKYGAYLMVRATTGQPVLRAINDGTRYRVELVLRLRELELTVDQLREQAESFLHFKPVDPWVAEVADEHTITSIEFFSPGRVQRRLVQRRDLDQRWLDLLEGQSFNGIHDRLRGFFDLWPDRQDEYLDRDHRGYEGHRTLGQARDHARPWERERWYDPAHGYRLALVRSYNYPSASWQLRADWQADYKQSTPKADDPATGHETEVLEWAELRPGQWYPRLTRIRHLRQEPDGRWVEWRKTGRPVVYRYILARPLEQVDESWFHLPRDWLEGELFDINDYGPKSRKRAKSSP